MLITDVHSVSHLQIIEEASSKNNHRPTVRGLFQRADEANQNKRVYPKTILENQVKKLQPLIKERRLCGELDHPQNDTVKLTNASHLVTKLWMENSEVMGEAEILNTPNGKVAQALLADGVKIGISSRGLGTLSEDHMTGQKTVNEDYNLVTFDLVADPSTRGAYPTISESRILEEAKYEKTLKEAVSERVFITMLKNTLAEAKGDKKNHPGQGDFWEGEDLNAPNKEAIEDMDRRKRNKLASDQETERRWRASRGSIPPKMPPKKKKGDITRKYWSYHKKEDNSANKEDNSANEEYLLDRIKKKLHENKLKAEVKELWEDIKK